MRNHRLERSLALVTLLACAAPARALASPVDPGLADTHPPGARPQAPSGADEEAVRLLGVGNRAFKEGHFAEAERAYREAFALRKGFDIAGNLGAAELAQGKLREAAQHLAFTLRMFPLTGEPALREQMAKAFDQCRQGVAAVRVEVDLKPGTGATPSHGAAIFVDGAAVGEAPLADEVFVEPGEHVVEARLEGYAGALRRVSTEKGAAAAVTLELTPLPPEPVAVAPLRRRSLVPGVALVAVAAVGLGSGAGFLGLSAGRRADAATLSAQIVGSHQGCVGGAANYDAGSCPTLASTLRADDTYHDVGVGALLVGGAAAVGAATYFLLPQRRPSSGLRVTPILGSGDGGVVVSGSF